MKYTKGPWTRDKNIRHGAPEILGNSDEYGIRRICKVLYGPGSEDREVEANAHLIAAAPELLQRLEDARDAIASLDENALGSGTTEVMGHEERWPIRDELLDYISKAIRKAKGEHEPN